MKKRESLSLNARLRVDKPGYREKPPDACFVGAVIHTTKDGRRWLDIKQVCDCKLVVRAADGKIRFQSIGESVIAQPDLQRTGLSLAELMPYSLHRKVVSNSMNMTPLNTSRHRRSFESC